RLRPSHVPVAFVGRQKYAFALPVNKIGRRSQAKLRVFFVVRRVGKVIGVTELHQPRILHSAVFLVFSFGGTYRLRASLEMYPIVALCVTQAGRAVPVLS